MIVLEDLEIEKKLEILSDAAKYDVACTSSGVELRKAWEMRRIVASVTALRLMAGVFLY